MGCNNTKEENIHKKPTPIIKENNNNDHNDSHKVTFRGSDKRSSILHHNDIPIVSTNLIRKNTTKVKDAYKFIEVLGRGAYGTYYKVLHIKLNQYRVAKIIPKEYIKYKEGDRTVIQEIEILSRLDHPNIIKLYDFFDEENDYYIITELATGGQLYDAILKFQNYNELNAVIIIKQILSALYYLHSYGIIHRDITPENIEMETNKLGDFNIKIIDFGTAIFGETKNDINFVDSSPYYQAPEILKKIITDKCDIWSCGVILYILLCGYPPFKGGSEVEITIAAEIGDYNFNSVEWDNISELAKKFVRKLLTIDYEKRPSAEEALQDPWIKKIMNSKIAQVEVCEKTTHNVFENLRNFTARQKLQQASIAFLVHQMTTNEHTKELRQIFKKMDKNGEGRLTKQELTDGYRKYFKSDFDAMKELEDVLNNIDQDKNGYIEYEEFLRATIDIEVILTENNLNLAFEYFDSDIS